MQRQAGVCFPTSTADGGEILSPGLSFFTACETEPPTPHTPPREETLKIQEPLSGSEFHGAYPSLLTQSLTTTYARPSSDTPINRSSGELSSCSTGPLTENDDQDSLQTPRALPSALAQPLTVSIEEGPRTSFSESVHSTPHSTSTLCQPEPTTLDVSEAGDSNPDAVRLTLPALTPRYSTLSIARPSEEDTTYHRAASSVHDVVEAAETRLDPMSHEDNALSDSDDRIEEAEDAEAEPSEGDSLEAGAGCWARFGLVAGEEDLGSTNEVESIPRHYRISRGGAETRQPDKFVLETHTWGDLLHWLMW